MTLGPLVRRGRRPVHGERFHKEEDYSNKEV
jgi:hypothetical protein